MRYRAVARTFMILSIAMLPAAPLCAGIANGDLYDRDRGFLTD